MRKMTAKQKQQLMGLLDWFFSSLEEDTGVTTVAPRNAKDSRTPAKQIEDLTDDDSDAAALTAEQHAAQMRSMAHPDASATGNVPAGFVPTAQQNGRPTGSGAKTDAPMVKRI